MTSIGFNCIVRDIRYDTRKSLWVAGLFRCMRLGNRKINEAEINKKTRLFATNVSVANLIVVIHCPQIVQFRPWQLHLQKFCSERIHRDTGRRFVFKFREIWPTGNR